MWKVNRRASGAVVESMSADELVRKVYHGEVGLLDRVRTDDDTEWHLVKDVEALTSAAEQLAATEVGPGDEREVQAEPPESLKRSADAQSGGETTLGESSWYVRYPAAVGIVVALWWFVSSDSKLADNNPWLVAALYLGYVVYALWLTREVSKYVIGFGLVYWIATMAGERIDQMSSAEAILIGAAVIAYVIHISSQRKK